jgi:CheY-like chemotaxis protein
MKNYFLALTLICAPLLASETEDITMWIALFALAFVGIVALFLSSVQLSKIKSEHSKMMKHQEEIEQRQSELLVEMGKNIQNITKETIGNTSKLKTTNESVQKHISKVIQSEHTIIDATSDLIEFLQIKSKKVHPLNEVFKLENLLNDILGQIKSNHSKLDLDLIFDVDDNIPDMLNSDTLGISKILVNLIEFCIVNSSTQIALQVSKRSKFNAPTTLHFVIYSDTTVKVDKNIFKTKYNEKTKKYDGMALFVSNELAELMGGGIIARNNHVDSGVEFVLNLPFNEVSASTLKEHRLDVRKTENKKIFLIDSSPESTLAIKRVLQAIKCDVDTKTKDDFLSKIPDFSNYETIIITEKLINSEVVKKISQIPDNKKPNILTLSNIFSEPLKQLVDSTILHKPITKESIYYTLLSFEHNDQNTNDTIQAEEKLIVHRDRFVDAPNITLESFSDFSDKDLLIVEDNLINQKVITSVLKKSNMNITIANDGQEALDILSNNNKFDMVLMDINMPVMDGYEATRKIRQQQSLDMIPVVALSALTATDEINKVFHVGMNGYLSKPLEKEKLYTAFDTFINKNTNTVKAYSTDKKEILENLEGLNIESGLKQASNNPIFYIEVLKEFLDAYGESGELFDKLIYDFRYEQARMLCLDMRGLAGAVGADDLQELSGEILQKIVFKKYDILPDYVSTYKEKLDILKGSIQKYIDANS